ncbi:MAG: peptidase SpoIVB, partial [Firmicutes bacterium]|nr:peptidase SpoIVB [Bacillota bacterium]
MAGCRRVALIAAFCLLPGLVAAASPEILPVDQVAVGMKGIAKTVVTGTQIEEFGVEVLGVMKNKGPSGDLILVRTYGDVIDRTGGIAQGMSGSPVY